MNETPDYEPLFYKRHLNTKAPVRFGLSITNVLEFICQLLTLPVGYLYSDVATGDTVESTCHVVPIGQEV